MTPTQFAGKRIHIQLQAVDHVCLLPDTTRELRDSTLRSAPERPAAEQTKRE
jgi:hypothetical protein